MEKGFLEFPSPKHLHVTTKQKKYLSIDLGLDNLVSAVSSESDTFLISFKLKDKIFNTIQKRKRLVKNYLHKVSCQIVQYCINH